nr:interferon regulatory factor 5-like isoform X2 [Petromyzon marinus]
MPGKCHTLLRDWLGNLANAGLYGVAWEDDSRSAVRIPWDSTKKRLSRDTDSIFRAYATMKGRVDSSKPSDWRQSLRCALERMLECETDGAKLSPPELFRVYRLFPRTPGRPAHPSCSLNQRTAEVSQVPEFRASAMSHLQNSFGEMNIEPHGATLLARGMGEDPVLCPPLETTGVFCGPEVCLAPGTQGEVAHHLDPCIALPHHHHHHLPAPGEFYQGGAVQPFVHDSNVSMESVGSFQGAAVAPAVMEELMHRLKVTISYFGHVVLMTEVAAAAGVPVGCLVCNEEWEPSEVARYSLPGMPEPHVLRLPAPPPQLEEVKREEVAERLSIMGNGLLLEATPKGVEATRLCRCRVFYSGPGQHASERANALTRADKRTRARTLLYDFADFLQKMSAWYDGSDDARRRPPPDCDVVLCLGSKWPNGKAAHNKAITVQVTHVHSEMLLATATGKEDPELSVPNSADNFLSMMRQLRRSDSVESQ